MSRKRLLDLAYKRGKKLNIDNPTYVKCLQRFTVSALEEDMGEKGDITVEFVLSRNNKRIAKIISKESGVIAGIEELIWFYTKHNISVKQFRKDGEKVNSSDVILELRGKEFDLLKTERVGLNLLQRMSGIATLTNKLVEKCKPLLIAATRKTPWGNLDNKAVSLGGGGTHRLGLWESILIKENHLESLSKEGHFDVIKESLNRAWSNRDKTVFIEIEVESIKNALKAAEYFNVLLKKDNAIIPCIIMLDNFSPKEVAKTIQLLREKRLYSKILVEASGGITPRNILKYRDAGVDVVSMGYLTHSPKVLDLSQLIV